MALFMLFLLFQIGNDRYALEVSKVVEVLPQVHWKTIPQSPPGVAGVFNYHGSPTPLIDLVELATGIPTPPLMSTRIILVNYLPETAEGAGEAYRLGLLAEQVTTTLRCPETEFVDSGVAIDAAPYLGPVRADASGIIQRVEINRLLSSEVCDLLFRSPSEVA